MFDSPSSTEEIVYMSEQEESQDNYMSSYPAEMLIKTAQLYLVLLCLSKKIAGRKMGSSHKYFD